MKKIDLKERIRSLEAKAELARKIQVELQEENDRQVTEIKDLSKRLAEAEAAGIADYASLAKWFLHQEKPSPAPKTAGADVSKAGLTIKWSASQEEAELAKKTAEVELAEARVRKFGYWPTPKGYMTQGPRATHIEVHRKGSGLAITVPLTMAAMDLGSGQCGIWDPSHTFDPDLAPIDERYETVREMIKQAGGVVRTREPEEGGDDE